MGVSFLRTEPRQIPPKGKRVTMSCGYFNCMVTWPHAHPTGPVAYTASQAALDSLKNKIVLRLSQEEILKFRDDLSQMEKCLHGIHDPLPETFAYHGTESNALVSVSACRHCRCLYVERS